MHTLKIFVAPKPLVLYQSNAPHWHRHSHTFLIFSLPLLVTYFRAMFFLLFLLQDSLKQPSPEPQALRPSDQALLFLPSGRLFPLPQARFPSPSQQLLFIAIHHFRLYGFCSPPSLCLLTIVCHCWLLNG